jgi:hypothetical protein
MKKVKEMSREEFYQEFMKVGKVFDFAKFTISCNKCQSIDVEFGGRMQSDTSGVFYEGEAPEVKCFYVCKCHKCGNAFVLNKDYADDDIDSRNKKALEVKE